MKLISSRHAMSGFSLIEIMIVVFIIGLMSAAVALTVGESNQQAPLSKEAGLLRTAFRFAAEQSVLNGEILGLIVEQKSVDGSTSIGASKQWCYYWVRKISSQTQWMRLPKDTLEDHCLPEFIQWDFVVEGRQWVYDPHLERQEPVVAFAPSGESTPIEMALYESGTDHSTKEKTIERIEVDMLSNITPLDDENEDPDNADADVSTQAAKQQKSKKK